MKIAETLQTRKRRIYDVTNVLEGVGLIQKVGTNTVQWVPPAENSAFSTARFRQIHAARMDELRQLQVPRPCCHSRHPC